MSKNGEDDEGTAEWAERVGDEADYVDLPLTDDDVNEAIVAFEQADRTNWRTPADGRQPYYVGPRVSGDGSIDWRGDGWPE